MTETKNLLQKYLDKHLVTRLRGLIILSIVLIAAIIFEVVISGFNVLLAICNVLLGLFVGIFVSRMYHLSWDSETYHVVSNMDWIGAFIFAFYIIFIVGRSIIVGYWVHGTTYFGIVISITAGVMIGRLLGTRHSLIRIKNDLEKIRKSLS